MNVVIRLTALALLLSIFGLVSGAKKVKVTKAQQKVLLKGHNDLRSTLANGKAVNQNDTYLPSGQNIYKMSWSNSAAKTAQAWSNKCNFSHSPAAQRNGAGQNLYAYSAKQGYADALNASSYAWWSELYDYGITQLNLTSEEFNRGVGHFTQVAWGNTKQVGCGVTWCPNYKWKTIVVCNYLPAGNYLNENFYEEGSPCSADSDCTTYDNSTCETATGLCVA